MVKVGQQESAYGPQLLPDGDNLLFTLASGNAPDRWERAKIVIQSLRSGNRKILISGGSDARHLPTGHIVYVMAGTIYAVRFDPRRLETAGTPVAILEGVMRAPVGMSAASQFAVSANGLLAYIAGPTTGAADRYDLSLVNRRGEAAPLKLPPGPYESPRVSRDGKWIAFGSEDSSGSFVLVYNLDGKTAPRRLTFNGKNRMPIWTADGNRVIFQSDREGDLALFWQAVDGSGTGGTTDQARDRGAAHSRRLFSPTETPASLRCSRARPTRCGRCRFGIDERPLSATSCSPRRAAHDSRPTAAGSPTQSATVRERSWSNRFRRLAQSFS